MRKSGRGRLLVFVGALAVLAAAAISIDALAFEHHSDEVGHALVKRAEAATRLAQKHNGSTSTSCTTSTITSSPPGVLYAPAIGLVAPVENGTSDAVLAVAVGHDPHSVWPGTRGTAVLEAHDVSYFVDTSKLALGAELRYSTPCRSYLFSVTGEKVVSAGTPIYNTPGPSVVLVTCWPTDALWFTPDRFVVTATEVAVKHAGVGEEDAGTLQVASAPPRVPAPPALVAQGLTLATNYIPMGTMHIVGTSTQAWRQSPAPLAIAGSGVEELIAGLRSAREGEVSWWRGLAPHVALPPPLYETGVASFTAPLNVELAAHADNVSTVVLSASVLVPARSGQVPYTLRVVEQLRNSTMAITGFQLERAN